MRGGGRQRGQAALLLTISIVVTIGMMGLAVDIGWAYYRRQACKAAAQAAAMAAIKVAQAQSTYFTCATGEGSAPCQATPTPCPAILDKPTNAIHAACLYAARNGFVNDANGRQSVMVSAYKGTPPVSGISNPTFWVSVTVADNRPVWFGSILGARFLKVASRATAAYVKPSVGGCIYTLAPTGTSVTNDGNPLLQSGCGMFVNSNSPEAVFLNGNAQILATNGSDVHIVGSWNSTGGATISPQPKTGESPVGDPFAGMSPPPNPSSCDFSGVSVGNHEVRTITPIGGVAVVCGGINVSGQAQLRLDPGLYIIKDGFSVSGQASVVGEGVTLYIQSGALSLSGGTDLHLTAPQTGAWQGILFYQDRANSSEATVVGGATADMEGVFYFPSANLKFAGGGASNRFAATIVTKTLSLVGNAYIKDPVTTKFTAGNAGVYLIE